MYEFHRDKQRYFDFTYRTTKDYLIPFLGKGSSKQVPLAVLEIGCGEGGVLKAFLERGSHCTGIELHAPRVETAREFMAEFIKAGKLELISRNIYDIDPEKDLGRKFDLIILKDVIEHIPDQERFIPLLKNFLAPGGRVLFAFPPWHMPFGGHQQMCRNKLLSKLPWFHLAPMGLYKGILKMGGEEAQRIKELEEVKETGISTSRFERIVEQSGMKVVAKKMWLFNPIYKFKFNIAPREQVNWVSSIPVVKDFFSTAAYYLISIK